MLYRRAAWIGLSILAMIPPVAGQEGPKRSFEVSSTQHVAFAAGGVIRLQLYGYLAVEGWDEPEVEIIVTSRPTASMNLVRRIAPPSGSAW